jgi:hypothetical protein
MDDKRSFIGLTVESQMKILKEATTELVISITRLETILSMPEETCYIERYNEPRFRHRQIISEMVGNEIPNVQAVVKRINAVRTIVELRRQP